MEVAGHLFSKLVLAYPSH